MGKAKVICVFLNTPWNGPQQVYDLNQRLRKALDLKECGTIERRSMVEDLSALGVESPLAKGKLGLWGLPALFTHTLFP